MKSLLFIVAWTIVGVGSLSAQQKTSPSNEPLQISGIYPHLAMWNDDGECGTGAVVPWANQLWVITYAPHRPHGSSDQLYSITPDLELSPFAGSIGGTPANRMIHRETEQLIIGPYVIDRHGNVRTIPYEKMPGRLTGSARHLFQPEKKVYFSTMEEGIYEVDMKSLDVTTLFRDHQGQVGGTDSDNPIAPLASLPGYHGKGLFMGQGRLIYANNGETSDEALRRPDIPSGCLAEWDGRSNQWTVIRRNQFTDIRGPGGLNGNSNPETDPVWAIGWDHRSLILMLLDDGAWFTYRLPKASHAYDGAHGWNTEWPRFNDIGETDLALNMHGMFWRFPKTFSRNHSAGIQPRSTYLKVVGDFCLYRGQLVLGCDDTAKNEFLNKRKSKGEIAGPGQSHSNLWFIHPTLLDKLGTPIGRGAVWLDDAVAKDHPSDPFLMDGFDHRGLFLSHGESEPVEFHLEVDQKGTGQWDSLATLTVPAGSTKWYRINPAEPGIWIRISTNRNCDQATAQFHFANIDTRSTEADSMFDAIAKPNSTHFSNGLVRVRGNHLKTLAFVGQRVENGKPQPPRFYELDSNLKLKIVDDDEALKWTTDRLAIPTGAIATDPASAIYIDDDGKRWRLPRGKSAFGNPSMLGPVRVSREVVTERDLFNCGGMFYELSARNAGGFAKIRPICTHNRRISDYCSYRGLLILSGVENNHANDNQHVLRSDDGQVALWAGTIDDLWKFGKPVGSGGPWFESAAQPDVFSDPYLMTGFDKKTLQLSHGNKNPITITAEVDITGNGNWVTYQTFNVPGTETVSHVFPEAFNAYWIRFQVSEAAIVTAQLTYR